MYGEAGTLSGQAARVKYTKAGKKYSAALQIKPDEHEVLKNWGRALTFEARTMSGEAARAK